MATSPRMPGAQRWPPPFAGVAFRACSGAVARYSCSPANGGGRGGAGADYGGRGGGGLGGVLFPRPRIILFVLVFCFFAGVLVITYYLCATRGNARHHIG